MEGKMGDKSCVTKEEAKLREALANRLDRDYRLGLQPPADLSFCGLTTFRGKEGAVWRSWRSNKKPILSSDGRIISPSLWLSENRIQDLSYMAHFLNQVMEAPARVQWLDLSYNRLTSIEEELLLFKELRTLYLHGNCISDVEEVKKLQRVQALRHLTLFDSGLEAAPGYREHVVATLPQLTRLDFSLITPRERAWVRKMGLEQKLSIVEEIPVQVVPPRDEKTVYLPKTEANPQPMKAAE